MKSPSRNIAAPISARASFISASAIFTARIRRSISTISSGAGETRSANDMLPVTLRWPLCGHLRVTGNISLALLVSPAPEEIVEIDRLMRAVKIAEAEMNDARAEIGAAIFRDGDFMAQ